MTWAAHMAQAEEFEKRFLEKMPRTDDPTLLVLKGHLLIEELINSTIDTLLPSNCSPPADAGWVGIPGLKSVTA